MSNDFGLDPAAGSGFDDDDDIEDIDSLMAIASNGEVEEDEVDVEALLGLNQIDDDYDENGFASEYDSNVDFDNSNDFADINNTVSIAEGFEDISFEDESSSLIEEFGSSTEDELAALLEDDLLRDDVTPDLIEETITNVSESDENSFDYTPERTEPKHAPQQIPEEQIDSTFDSYGEKKTQESNLAPVTETQTKHQEIGKPKMNIRKESDFIDETAKIIKTLDVYRNIEHNTRSIVAQFITSDGDVDSSNESLIIVKALTAPSSLETTMAILKHTIEEENRVNRAFYILKLSVKELNDLGDFVSILLDESIAAKGDHIEYSKNIEESIDKLDDAILGYVSATKAVLNAASGKE